MRPAVKPKFAPARISLTVPFRPQFPFAIGTIWSPGTIDGPLWAKIQAPDGSTMVYQLEKKMTTDEEAVHKQLMDIQKFPAHHEGRYCVSVYLGKRFVGETFFNVRVGKCVTKHSSSRQEIDYGWLRHVN